VGSNPAGRATPIKPVPRETSRARSGTSGPGRGADSRAPRLPSARRGRAAAACLQRHARAQARATESARAPRPERAPPEPAQRRISPFVPPPQRHRHSRPQACRGGTEDRKCTQRPKPSAAIASSPRLTRVLPGRAGGFRPHPRAPERPPSRPLPSESASPPSSKPATVLQARPAPARSALSTASVATAPCVTLTRPLPRHRSARRSPG
jgi:hypothetical protein